MNWSNYIQPLDIHRQYGVLDIPGVEVIDWQPSTHVHKKYAITIAYQGRTATLHYGDDRYQHYQDRTPLKTFQDLDHYDEKRRASYLARAK